MLFSRSVVSNSLRPHGLQPASSFSVPHCLLEFAQTHVHWLSDNLQGQVQMENVEPLVQKWLKFSQQRQQGIKQASGPSEWGVPDDCSCGQPCEGWTPHSKTDPYLQHCLTSILLLPAPGLLRIMVKMRKLPCPGMFKKCMLFSTLPTFVCAVPSVWNTVPYLLHLATPIRSQLRLQVFWMIPWPKA